MAALRIAFALVCNQIISALWPHPRPFMIGLGHTFLAHQPEASFPSDHATLLFTLVVALMSASLYRLGVLILLLGIAVGWLVFTWALFPFRHCRGAVGRIRQLLAACGLLTKRQLGARLLSGLEALYRHLFALPIAKGWVRA